MHTQCHPLAEKTVILSNGKQFIVIDWWDRISGESWIKPNGNLVVIEYAVRVTMANINGFNIPMDDEIVYGKVDGNGYLIHKSEI